MVNFCTLKEATMTLDKDMATEMYRRMLRIRYFDERAIELMKKGQIPGPMHASIGQEAEVVGACMAFRITDYMAGNHRSHGHPIGKGSRLDHLMAELLGKSTGVCKGKGGSMHLADFKVGSIGESGIVGSSMALANGAALSAKLRGTDQVALAFFGDGGANCGPFHESLNLAAIWKLPVVFICENNGYAVSTPVSYATSIPNIADRAASYGIPGVIVDGQDPVAVFQACETAVARCRAGDGPTLIEARTYRYREHAEFGGMERNLRQYRTEDEVEQWRSQRDPIANFRRRLLAEWGVTDEEASAIEAEVSAEADAAVTYAIDSPWPEPQEVFTDLYATAVPIRS